MMNRRQAVTGALAASLTIPAAMIAITPLPALSAGAALTDADPWVRLCAERLMLHELAEASVVDGNIPDDVADFCWGRVAEIDGEIGASQPATPRGLRAALVEYLRDVEGCTITDEALLVSLFRAALAAVDRAST